MVIHKYFTLICMRETIYRGFSRLHDLLYRGMKSMKKSSSYISTYKHLVFESDHSMIMTVLLLSVWLHNVQVTICCFLRGEEEGTLLYYSIS